MIFSVGLAGFPGKFITQKIPQKTTGKNDNGFSFSYPFDKDIKLTIKIIWQGVFAVFHLTDKIIQFKILIDLLENRTNFFAAFFKLFLLMK